MSKKIMVPLDGSPFAERALSLAVAVAHRSGAELRLVHVVVPLANKVFIEEDGGQHDYLNDLADRITRESGVRAVAVRRTGRQAVGELSYYSAEEDVDLVVMATHGWGGLQRAWLGSVTDGLIREARVPVITFRPAEKGAPRLDGKAIEEILIPLDGSTLSESILAPTLELGGLEARYTLVRVVPVVAPSADVTGVIELGYRKELVTAMREGAAEYLSEIADRLRAKGHEVQTRVLMHPQPARAILSQAAEIEADLIALATHGRGGIARFALGSVTDKVLRGADTPVLVMRGEVRERVAEGVMAEDPVSWKELVAAG